MRRKTICSVREYYVESLNDNQLARHYANLNFDMVGSPNYVRFVYDGDGSDEGPAGPPGSAQIEQLFTSYFASQSLASEPTAFDGRSDYGPFIAVGIRPVVCSPAPRESRLRRRQPSTAGLRASLTTRATTRRATHQQPEHQGLERDG